MIVSKIRVLIADDSALIRNFLKSFFLKDPEIELVAAAKDGLELLAFAQEYEFDIVVLDIIMPKLDGIDTLIKLKEKGYKQPIIMYSSLTHQSDEQYTIKALTLGATDFCQKPIGFGGKKLSADGSVQILIDKIKAIIKETKKGTKGITSTPLPSGSTLNREYDLILIGSSTGGPEALKTIFSSLVGQLPPVLIVQHMPASFTRVLACNLNNMNNLSVKEAKKGDKIIKGQALLAPGDFHMGIISNQVTGDYSVLLNQNPPVNSCRPSIDILFKSVANNFKGSVLALILTGMGSDGVNGVKALKHKNKVKVIIQNKESSSVWGMPAAIQEAKLDDECLDILEISKLFHKLSISN